MGNCFACKSCKEAKKQAGAVAAHAVQAVAATGEVFESVGHAIGEVGHAVGEDLTTAYTSVGQIAEHVNPVTHIIKQSERHLTRRTILLLTYAGVAIPLACGAIASGKVVLLARHPHNYIAIYTLKHMFPTTVLGVLSGALVAFALLRRTP